MTRVRMFALVIACAIAGGVGSRLALGSDSDPATATTSAVSPAPSAPETATTVDIAAEAESLLGERRSQLMEACGIHTVGTPPGSVVVSFDLGFDAAGQLRAWGVSADRDTSAEALLDCLRGQPLPLKVSAAGIPVTLSVPLALP